MDINWKEAHKDYFLKELKGKKDHIRDMIDGELNRISVSDTIGEKIHLYSVLKDNIERYYNVCCEYTKRLSEYQIGGEETDGT